VRPRNPRNDARDPARNEQGGPRDAVRTAADVRRVLSEEIEYLRTNPDLDPLRRAGLIAQLAPVLLRAIELSTLEARLEAVDAVLRPRKDHQPLRRSDER
jgi:hypothetical protein